jgi:hypothetical protein
MRIGDATVQRCNDCGWAIRPGDVPLGRRPDDLLWSHRQACPGGATGRRQEDAEET